MEGFYIDYDETLVIDYQTLLSSIVLDTFAFGTIDGKKRQLGAQQIPLTGDGAVNSVTVLRGPCLVESVSAIVASGTVLRGEVAVGARILHVSGSRNITSYVAPIQFPCSLYPAQNLFKPTLTSVDDGVITRVVTLSNPAAGSEFSQAVPTGVLWKPQAVRIPLTTSATVANRRVNLAITDGTNTIVNNLSNTDQAASLTYTYSFSNTGGSQQTNGVLVSSMLSDLPWLPAGYVIGSATLNLQVGDDFGQGYLTVQQRLTLC